MVFSSVPLYPDPPHWNQQQESTNKLLINEPTQASSSPSQTNTCNRPVTMAERAKMAKIPQAEAALKCPRCDSTNTKFCYFNNYSLTQPRHFCKTCRRYWTRGGALRSVPVGGGCRRNKRGNKPSSSSKSSTPVAVPTNPPPAPPPTFLAPWHHMQDYGFGGIQEGAGAPAESMGLEQWRIQQIQQFPFLGGGLVEQTAMMVPGLYPFEEHGKINNMPIVKMEESNSSQVVVRAEAGSSSAVNFPRQFFNMGEQHLSGFNSSSNGNFL